MTRNSTRALAWLLMGAAMLAASLATTAVRADDEDSQRVISVTASGTVTAEPDIALISTGVASEARTAREALDANSAAMRRLIGGLKAAGIEPRDIQTTSLNVEPVYEQRRDNRSPAITGYRVHNQVRITARDIDKLGEVLDQAVTLGANQIGGIQFEVSKAETLKDEARRTAIANARRRAELFAAAAGVKLGRVLRIEERVQHHGPPVPYARTMAAEAVPIEKGTQTLEAVVSVTWELD